MDEKFKNRINKNLRYSTMLKRIYMIGIACALYSAFYGAWQGDMFRVGIFGTCFAIYAFCLKQEHRRQQIWKTFEMMGRNTGGV